MTDTGYGEWLAAVAGDEGYYLACPDGRGSLPSRRSYPYCGATELTGEPLPAMDEVLTFIEVHVLALNSAGETPCVAAIASFGPVRLTGVAHDLPIDKVDLDTIILVDVGENATIDKRLIVFRSASE